MNRRPVQPSGSSRGGQSARLNRRRSAAIVRGREERWVAGIIEGFYGKPWMDADRVLLFDWLTAAGLNTYIYAPKEDLNQRLAWQDPIARAELVRLKTLATAGQKKGLRFVYALAPGLDLAYSNPEHWLALRRKAQQVLHQGIQTFVLCFDDIPFAMREEEKHRFGSLAAGQAFVANQLFHFLTQTSPAARLWFCPTIYCGAMARQNPEGTSYLSELGARLHPAIDVFWTGPAIVSVRISATSLSELSRLLRRKPMIWDNLYANDYDRRRIYFGPYAGRARALRRLATGMMLNPHCQFQTVYPLIRIFGAFCRGRSVGGSGRAYWDALRAWLPFFRSKRGPAIDLEDLEWLADIFYLPFAMGKRASRFLTLFQTVCSFPPRREDPAVSRFGRWSKRLQDLYAKCSLIANRPLWFALEPYLWDLKEEMILLDEYVSWWLREGRKEGRFASPNYRFPLYRGGFIAALHRLLPMDAAGTLRACRSRRKETLTKKKILNGMGSTPQKKLESRDLDSYA